MKGSYIAVLQKQPTRAQVERERERDETELLIDGDSLTSSLPSLQREKERESTQGRRDEIRTRITEEANQLFKKHNGI